LRTGVVGFGCSPSRLTRWLSAPDAARALRFLEDGGDWTRVTYPELGSLSRRTAGAIAEHAAPGDGPVAIVLPNGLDFVATFFGSLLSGRPACPLAPRLAFADAERYTDHLVRVLGVARPSLIVTEADAIDQLRQAARRAGLDTPVVRLAPDGAVEIAPADLPETAVIQFTSGSTGQPRGALVSTVNVEANLEMNTEWLDIRSDDAYAGWLPLFHDMGLVSLLTMMGSQIDIAIMRPDQFIRFPGRWLRCMGRDGATISVTPTFGIAYAARRAPDEDLAGCDFGGWRTVVVGSDPVSPRTLTKFLDRLHPYGFRPSTFVPAYGLAEATLSVSGRERERALRPRHEGPAVLRIDCDELRFGGPVSVLDRGVIAHRADFGDASGWITSCGPPHRELTVTIVDEQGTSLAEGHLGEILVSGPTAVDGYIGETAAHSSHVAAGVLHTGDAGFLLDGCLYIIGRLGDALKVRGVSVFAEDLDARLAAVPQIRRGRCVTLTGSHCGRTTVVALVEADPGPWVPLVAKSLTRGLPADVDIKVASVPLGTIDRTTSGKPRRRGMWTAFANGSLETKIVLDGRNGVAGTGEPARAAVGG
jgi:fatty-acyl-CoA synthase